MAELSVTLSGVQLKNPVIPASGVFGYGEPFTPFYDLNILGSFAMKGTTKKGQFGNPTPRIAECTAGLINSVGLQNPGIDAVEAEELPRIRAQFSGPLIFNVCGYSVDEYREVAQRADALQQVEILEINISCPNVSHGGMSFGTTTEGAAQVIGAVKRAVKKPVYAKLSPNVTDIAEIARACVDAGADGLSLINTLLGMRIDLHRRRPVIAREKGGFSGPAIFPVALRMVYEVYQAVNVPIMGMGGVQSARDVIEMMLAGATAVQVGAANLVNPNACEEIINELPLVMEELGIRKLTDIIGGAHP